MLQRDRFELLSAYLDGEVTADERRQAEDLLANDDKSKQLYARLLKLREGFQGMPLAQPQPVEDTVAQVMNRLDRRRTPSRRTWALGGAVAAAMVASLSGLFGPSPIGQFARGPVPDSSATIDPVLDDLVAASPQAIAVIMPVSDENLMISIDQPLLGLSDGIDSSELTPIPSPDAGLN